MKVPVDRPWWKYGHVWLVLAGPAAAVAAGTVTAVIAVRGADPLVPQERARVPAMQGRNHAATPAAVPTMPRAPAPSAH